MGPLAGLAALGHELGTFEDEGGKRTVQWCRVIGAVVVLIAAVVSLVASGGGAEGEHANATSTEDVRCTLTGNRFAWLVQFALLAAVIAVLVYKRVREHPKRTWKEWFLDTSKQAVSSGAAHGCGILNSMILAHFTDPTMECGWYFASYTVDTTFGVWCAVTFLVAVEKVAKEREWSSLVHTGVYPNYVVWAKQLVAFTAMVIVARGFCAVLLCALIYVLEYPVQGLCHLFEGRPHLFLVVVMCVGPGLMNAVQVWVQDNYLKRQDLSDEGAVASDQGSADASLDTHPRSLPQAPSDEEADERAHMIP